jgi:hypothetical protein
MTSINFRLPKRQRAPAAALCLPEVFFIMNFSGVRCRANGCNKPYAWRRISLIREGIPIKNVMVVRRPS